MSVNQIKEKLASIQWLLDNNWWSSDNELVELVNLKHDLLYKLNNN